MTALPARRFGSSLGAELLGFGAAASAAVAFGALVAIKPALAVGAVALGGAVALAWFAPVANFTLLVFLIAIVPYGLQNQYSLGGAEDSPGLLASDLILTLGLARAAVSLVQSRLDRRTRIVCVALIAFIGIGALQMLHGMFEGRALNAVGAEYRVFVVLGGSALIAVSLLIEPDTRRRLLYGMVVLGLALGVWALIQWTVDIPLGEEQDVGVREGISQTTSGRGQLQGGLFSFPVAAIMAAAALLSGNIRSRAGTAVAMTIFVLNLVGLVLTYERTFWVTTALGLLLVAVTMSRRARIRALFWGPLALVVFFVVMSTVAPDTLGAARERLLSLGRYESDNSLRFRLTESRHVVDEIKQSPVFGSGLAASIYWGRPWEGVKPTERTFAHNAYLWLAWKLGLVGAVLLVGAILFVLIGRAPPTADPLFKSLRTGAKASLLALALTSVTFPAFTLLAAAAGVGLLIAFSVVPMRWRYPAGAREGEA
jgi:O-antigen ligase/polysaccharide polymerase Wzy-like membrane protein